MPTTCIGSLFVNSSAVMGTSEGHLNVPAVRKLGPDPPDALDYVDILCERLLRILQFHSDSLIDGVVLRGIRVGTD